ncbi:recombinase family protein [Streptomyces acidiscabies]|uniref:recombinase family protein n=1 Tax=Streptomyces acidiscabies TaxID=42234 RepID=UPI0009518975|nr:recombinase family protein [Streptomyces acidiscabies]
MPFAPEYLHLVIPDTVFEAWLYGRNSDDATKSGDSVEDQLTTGRALCVRHNWRMLHEFKDTGLSASRHAKKTREEFEELIDAINNNPAPTGVRRIVVAYNAARYYRDLEAYVRLRKACLTANVLLCYNGQVYDLSRRDDRKATAMHAVDAEDEAEGLYDQNLRTANLQASEGHPHGKMIYGYLREYATVGGRRRCIKQYEDPVRGKYVFKALHRADTGHSIGSIKRWLGSVREAERHDGEEWSNRNVRSMLLNRAYLGERLHKGAYHKASWDPIKGLETPEGKAMFLRVEAKLLDPARVTHRGTEPTHLLSWIGACGVCGDHTTLSAYPHSGRGNYWVVGCKAKRDTAVKEQIADAFVEEAVVSWFSRKDTARAALIPDNTKKAEEAEKAQRLINGYEEQLREARKLALTFDPETGRPQLSVMALAEMEQVIAPKLEAERKKLESPKGVSPLLMRLLTADDPDEVWNGRPATGSEPELLGLSLEQKREVIRSVVTVRLHKASRLGIRGLEPGRITLAFVGEPGFMARRPPAPALALAEEPGQGDVLGEGTG